MWRGRGSGEYPTIEPFEYAQEIRISHDGRPFLAYESRAWLVTPEGEPIRPGGREVGWWRPVVGEDGKPTDEIEALFCTPTGIMELHLGRVTGVRLEMATDAVLRTSTAKEVTAGQRLYGIVDRDLLYAQDMAAVGQPCHATSPPGWPASPASALPRSPGSWRGNGQKVSIMACRT